MKQLRIVNGVGFAWLVGCAACGTSGGGSGGPVDGATSDVAGGDVATSDVSNGDGAIADATGDAATHDAATTDAPGAKDTSSPDAPPVETGPAGPTPTLAGCRIFPPDNAWNQDISALPISADSAKYLANMAVGTNLHPDWGTVAEQYGIPITTGTSAPPVPMHWTAKWGPTDSDKLPCADGSSDFCYPVPSTATIEGGPAAKTTSDRHVLFLDTAGAPNDCILYELYNAQNWSGGGWTAQNGAIFHLGSNTLRPDGLTSADAAGLPILPGLVRLDEVKAGAIHHAIRFTMVNSFQGYIHPGTHAAGVATDGMPPMGLRVRLKGTFDMTSLSAATQVILVAMQRYGLILADNGSDWYVSGETNAGWVDYMDALNADLGNVHGSDFEVVDTGPVSTAGL